MQLYTRNFRVTPEAHDRLIELRDFSDSSKRRVFERMALRVFADYGFKPSETCKTQRDIEITLKVSPPIWAGLQLLAKHYRVSYGSVAQFVIMYGLERKEEK